MDRLVVDAISVKRSQGDLSVRSDHQSDEDPEAVPVEFGNMVYVPRLVAIDCPKCSAEVRLDRFLADFPAATAMINPGDRLASTRQTLSAQLV